MFVLIFLVHGHYLHEKHQSKKGDGEVTDAKSFIRIFPHTVRFEIEFGGVHQSGTNSGQGELYSQIKIGALPSGTKSARQSLAENPNHC